MAKQTAIVIGIGPHLSRSISLYLAENGYRIGLITRKQSSLDKLADELKGQTDVYTATADAADEQSLVKALDDLSSKLGKIDVLVFNAARVAGDSIITLRPETLLQDFKTSAIGTLVAGQWFSEHANTKGQHRPLLIVTGGTLDRNPHPDYASLSAVKSASQSIAVMFSKTFPDKFGIQVGTPLIVEPIAPKEDGSGWHTKSVPDDIVKQVFKPFFDAREKNAYDDWVVERIF